MVSGIGGTCQGLYLCGILDSCYTARNVSSAVYAKRSVREGEVLGDIVILSRAVAVIIPCF